MTDSAAAEQRDNDELDLHLNSENSLAHQNESNDDNGDDEENNNIDDDDDEDDETIEFEIEIVSNDSSSKPSSSTDLRDESDDGDANNSLAAQELQLDSKSQIINEPTPIVDITNSTSAQSQQQSTTATAAELVDDEVDGTNEQQQDESISPSPNQLDYEEPEFELEIVSDDSVGHLSDSPQTEDDDNTKAATSIEITNNEIEIKIKILPETSDQGEDDEDRTVDQNDESEKLDSEESSAMKLKEEDSLAGGEILAENAQQIVTNDDLSIKSPPDRTSGSGDAVSAVAAAAAAAHVELFATTSELDAHGQSSSSSCTESTVGGERGDGGISKECSVPMESVGSRNIREIYKVLNSDSVLIVGCRPESVTEAELTATACGLREPEAKLQTVFEEPEVDQSGPAANSCTLPESTTATSDERPPTSQSPEITIEHPPEVEVEVDDTEAASFARDDRPAGPLPLLEAATATATRGRNSSDESASPDDLEWEFDNEPAFERRNVQVKRGKNPREEYELGNELGRGKFGTVFRCTHLESGRKLAAKFVLTRRKEDREDVEREVDIMSRLQHKRLLQLYDAFDNGTDEMCLVTELVEGGELFERIVDDDFDLTEKKAAIFMRQICEGVEYMHSLNIVHLDMKPENILCISRTGNRIKLIDFGLARQLLPNEALRVMFGTPDFAAPEVLCYDTVSLATDMWSVGVICYVLLSGLSPFMGNNDMETMANVTRATYDFDEAAFDPISELAKDFIAKLLVKDQSNRLKPNECLRHPWLARGGLQLEAAVRERRKSIAIESQLGDAAAAAATTAVGPSAISADQLERLNALVSSITVSLDKRNLKKYVVRRKWHKTVHAIMALGRMGAKLKSLIP